MRQVTLYRHNDSSARIVPWAEVDNMTELERTPVGAEILIYTTLPHDVVDYLMQATKDQVSEYLSSYLP
jgi:hypothetical protein